MLDVIRRDVPHLTFTVGTFVVNLSPERVFDFSIPIAVFDRGSDWPARFDRFEILLGPLRAVGNQDGRFRPLQETDHSCPENG